MKLHFSYILAYLLFNVPALMKADSQLPHPLWTTSGKILKEQLEEQKMPPLTTKEWHFTPSSECRRITFEFEHHLYHPTGGGWSADLRVAVNGTDITATASGNKLRILNKPVPVPMYNKNKSAPVCDINKNWYSLYAPSFNYNRQIYYPYNNEAYRVVIDVTDLIIKGQTNRIELRFLAKWIQSYYHKNKLGTPCLNIRGIRIIESTTPSLLNLPKERFTITGKALVDLPEKYALKTMTGKKITVPPVQSGKRITLDFEHIIHHPSGGGWTAPLQILINKKPISVFFARKNPRLLNKPFQIKHPMFKKFRACDGMKWYSCYAPNFDYDRESFFPYNAEAYRLVLDITDLMYADKKNQVEINFGGSWLPGWYTSQKYNIEPELILRNIKIIQDDVPSKIYASSKKNYIKMKKYHPVPFTVTEGDNALHFKLRNVTIPVQCSLSIPGNKKSYFYSSLHKPAENHFYRVRRTYLEQADHIIFHDTFENKTDQLIGIRICYRIPEKQFDLIRIGGDDSPENVLNARGSNPSAYLGCTKQNFGIGIIALDDVFRVQNQQFYENNHAGIRTVNFALSPKEKRTVEWSAYPMGSSDYFDFINLVRQDWKVNFPIEGHLVCLLPMKYDDQNGWLLKKVQDLGLKYVGCGIFSWPWIGGPYAKWSGTLHGSAMFDDFHRGRTEPNGPPVKIPCLPMRELLKKTVALAQHNLQSENTKVLSYIHTQISTEIDDLKKYADCAIIDKNGRPVKYGGKQSLYNLFLPTPDNAFGKKTIQFAKDMIDKLGFDGIYNDEFNHSGPRITYGTWDKVSVELDENNCVKRKIGFVALLKLPFNLQLLDEFLVKRKVPFIANFAPETRSELKYHFPRFEETFNACMPLGTHLYTPIQKGDQLVFPMTPQGMMDDIRNAISNGLLYYYYINRTASPAITRLMYPFTPIELHSGWLLGKERILTIYSGEFGWYNQNSLAIPYITDPTGKTITAPDVQFINTADGTRCRLILPENHCAVLVRIPIAARLTENARLKNLTYDNKMFTAILCGTGKAFIETEALPGQTLPNKISRTFIAQGKDTLIHLPLR